MEISKLESALRLKLKNYPNRIEHSFGVCEMAQKLAQKFDVDQNKVSISALLHDICKYESFHEMKSLINDEKIILKYENCPEIYHAYAGANYAKHVLNIEDEQIIDAIRYHVMGRLNMSKLEEIIYISDFIEINRTNPSSIECRELIDFNYNRALYLSYKYTIEYLEEKNEKVLEEQYQLLEFYKNKGEFND